MRMPSCLFVMLARGKFCGYQTRQELPRLWTPPTPSDGTLFYNNGYSLPDSARSRCYTVLRSMSRKLEISRTQSANSNLCDVKTILYYFFTLLIREGKKRTSREARKKDVRNYIKRTILPDRQMATTLSTKTMEGKRRHKEEKQRIPCNELRKNS